MKFLRDLFGIGRTGPPVPPPFDAPIQPSFGFFAIGDIHGRYDKLITLIEAICARDDNPVIVCVGDYIDRGEASSRVLRHLMAICVQNDPQFVCLIGNHEQMCLQFLDDPKNCGDRWLRNGGLQTLASFGVGRDPEHDLTKTRDALADRMGDALIGWMRDLPRYWISGNVAVVHAGADPLLPIGAQPTDNLLWDHPDFHRVSRADGMWVVHGHTVVEQPRAGDGRISVDTGAYATDRLTAAHIRRDNVSFVTV